MRSYIYLTLHFIAILMSFNLVVFCCIRNRSGDHFGITVLFAVEDFSLLPFFILQFNIPTPFKFLEINP